MATPKKLTSYTINKKRGKNFELTFDQFVFQIENLPEFVRRASVNFAVMLSKESLGIFRRNFDQGNQGFDGRPWQSLATSTVKKRAWMMKKFPSFTQQPEKKILTNFGILRKSLKINDHLKYNTAGKTFRRIYADPSEFKNQPIHRGFNYAGIMQSGRSGGVGSNGRHFSAIPARQFIGFSKKIYELEEREIRNYFIKGVFTETGGFGIGNLKSWELK